MRRKRVLRIADIVALPEVDVRIAAGAAGETNAVRWLHTSELDDPTSALEAGELLLTTGRGLGADDDAQRAFVRRLAAHGAAGLALGLGGPFGEPPAALLEEGDALGFPILAVGAGTSFAALGRLALTQLASDPIAQAHEVHEELVEAVLGGAGVRDLLRILGGALRGSLRVTDVHGVVLAEHHGGVRAQFDDGERPGTLVLPVGDGPAAATLTAIPPGERFGDYERLVLRHGQNALALELTRRQAVLAAELRLAGDLLDELEQERLDARETARRLAAFGLDAQRSHAALIAVCGRDVTTARLRAAIVRQLDRHGLPHLSSARHDGVAFLVDAPSEDGLLAIAEAVAAAEPTARLAVGRAANGPGLGRSLLEARAALDASSAPVVSWRDLSSFELLLSVPVPVLEAFVDRVLGPTVHNGWLVETLSVLLESGCKWKDAAEQLGVHRHTLRYRMDRLEEQTGRHPDRPDQRMELWLAVKALQAIAMRGGGSFEGSTDRV
jgi:PucR family transcriptional regulator, purine catabolism regulatory protein